MSDPWPGTRPQSQSPDCRVGTPGQPERWAAGRGGTLSGEERAGTVWGQQAGCEHLCSQCRLEVPRPAGGLTGQLGPEGSLGSSWGAVACPQLPGQVPGFRGL